MIRERTAAKTRTGRAKAENGEVHDAGRTECWRKPYAGYCSEMVAVGCVRRTLDALGASGREYGPHPMAGELRATFRTARRAAVRGSATALAQSLRRVGPEARACPGRERRYQRPDLPQLVGAQGVQDVPSWRHEPLPSIESSSLCTSCVLSLDSRSPGVLSKYDEPPAGTGPHRLAAQDTALSRRQHGFESRWGRRQNRRSERFSL